MGVDMPNSVGNMNFVSRKPSILVIGPRAVGKKTLISKIISTTDREALIESESARHSWTIDTKYYTAEVDVWVASIEDSSGGSAGPTGRQLADHHEALVMVFDQTDVSSFHSLKNWASGVNLAASEILLCVGNKADRVPDHFGHTAYRRHLLQRGEALPNPVDAADFGVQRTDGAALLAGDETEEAEEDGSGSESRRREYSEWCADNGVEYIEACAVNAGFDRGLSQDGDQQGVVRIKGALEAHMWPGLTLKPRGSSGVDAAGPTMDQHMSDAGDSEEDDSDDFSEQDDEADYAGSYELLEDEAPNEVWEPVDGGHQPLVDGRDQNQTQPGASQASVDSQVSVAGQNSGSSSSAAEKSEEEARLREMSRGTVHELVANGVEPPGLLAEWGEFQTGATGGLPPDPDAPSPLTMDNSSGRPADWVATEKPSFDSQLESKEGQSTTELVESEPWNSSDSGSEAESVEEEDILSGAYALSSPSTIAAAEKAATTAAEASVVVSLAANSAAAMHATPSISATNEALPGGRLSPASQEQPPAELSEVSGAGYAEVAEAEATSSLVTVPAAAPGRAQGSLEPPAATGGPRAAESMESLEVNVGSEDEDSRRGEVESPSRTQGGTGRKAGCTDGVEHGPEANGLRDVGGPLVLREEDMDKGDGEKGATRDGSAVDDMQGLMNEMASMREHARGMPDGVRRDMAARLALRMARLFGDEDIDDAL